MTYISLEDEFYKIAGKNNVLGDPKGEPAYLYARSSAKKQAEEGKESLSRQLLFAHEKASSDGRFIPLEMTYWDVWRGKDADRPEFLHLLTDLKTKQRSDLIYIDQTDRLSRNTAIYYVLLHDLTRHGITARFESEEDELVRHIKLAFDEIEIERRRYRQIQANKARATKGNVTSKYAAYGYKMSENKLKYEISDEQATWVKQIFDWFVGGSSLRGIAVKLNDLGVPTPQRAKHWHAETIRKILQHEIYKGIFIANRLSKDVVWEGGKQRVKSTVKPEDEWIQVPVPAIVAKQQWDEAQRLLQRNAKYALRNAKKHEWLLSGLLRCVCDHGFTSKLKKNKRKLASGVVKTYQYNYYRCTDHSKAYRGHCSRGPIVQWRIESHVLEAVESLIAKVELWEEVWDDGNDQEERLTQHQLICQQNIDELDAQIDELLQLALEQRNSRTRQLFSEKQKELENRREKYEEQLQVTQGRLQSLAQAADKRKTVERILEDLQKLGGIKKLPFEMQRKLLTQLVDEIVLDTKEQWFEIRGELTDTFCYASGQVVSISA